MLPRGVSSCLGHMSTCEISYPQSYYNLEPFPDHFSWLPPLSKMRLDSDLGLLERRAEVGMHRMFVGWSSSLLVFQRIASGVVGQPCVACRWGPFRVSVGLKTKEIKVLVSNHIHSCNLIIRQVIQHSIIYSPQQSFAFDQTDPSLKRVDHQYAFLQEYTQGSTHLSQHHIAAQE